MIRGSFREEGGRRRPFVSGFLEIPSVHRSGEVAWLIDTGADGTLLSPRDASLLGIDPDTLPPGPASAGIGGRTLTVQVPCAITLGQRRLDIRLRILAPRSRTQRVALAHIPSLLGRDILALFALFIEDRTDQVLLLDPDEARALHLPSL